MWGMENFLSVSSITSDFSMEKKVKKMEKIPLPSTHCFVGIYKTKESGSASSRGKTFILLS